MPSLIDRLGFDADWYVSAYPDVADALKSGRFRNAFDHYLQFGKDEARMPLRPRFDEEFYLAIYPDVAAAIMRGDFRNGLDHYVRCGHSEGRMAIEPREHPA